MDDSLKFKYIYFISKLEDHQSNERFSRLATFLTQIVDSNPGNKTRVEIFNDAVNFEKKYKKT
jgi:hypothetical protein